MSKSVPSFLCSLDVGALNVLRAADASVIICSFGRTACKYFLFTHCVCMCVVCVCVRACVCVCVVCVCVCSPCGPVPHSVSLWHHLNTYSIQGPVVLVGGCGVNHINIGCLNNFIHRVQLLSILAYGSLNAIHWPIMYHHGCLNAFSCTSSTSLYIGLYVRNGYLNALVIHWRMYIS